MNSLTSTQRKLVYLVAMLVLFVPIIALGLPAPGKPAEGQTSSGPAYAGLLAQKRIQYDLGETSLGNVDPTSATMNLVLLGMRGLAASQLWQQANEHQKNKNWAELRATTDSIILLQPHFAKIWNFQGWNLAFNVSAEWDKVDDRYYWVKEGIKFVQRGVRRNEKHPELYWYVGDWMGKKIGRSDEWKQFRGYFQGRPGYPDPEPDPEDPEPDIRKRRKRFPQGYDTQLNPDGRDNYLVSRDWFLLANEKESAKPELQHIMTNVLFRTYPARSQTDYAQALQREGSFDEVTREAWVAAYSDWVNGYGQDEFLTEAGMIRLEVSDAEMEQLAKDSVGVTNQFKTKKWWIQHYWKMVNYQYWRRRCLMEAERNVDHLIPTGVEPGDTFTISLKDKSLGHKAASADAGEVVKALADAWTKMTDPEFAAVRAEAAEEKLPDGTVRPYLRLTWSTTTVPAEVAVSATNGGENDEQKLVRSIHTRSIVEAHRELFEGQEAHFANDFVKAQELLSSGLQKFQQTIREYPDFIHDDDLTEEIMVGIHEWRQTLSLMEEEPPADHPLIEVWEWYATATIKDDIRREVLEATAATPSRDDFVTAERQIMDKRNPLTVLLTTQASKQQQVEMEYLRRLKTYTAPAR